MVKHAAFVFAQRLWPIKPVGYASYMGPGDWDTLLGWGKSVAYKVAFTNTSL